VSSCLPIDSNVCSECVSNVDEQLAEMFLLDEAPNVEQLKVSITSQHNTMFFNVFGKPPLNNIQMLIYYTIEKFSVELLERLKLVEKELPSNEYGSKWAMLLKLKKN